MYERLLEAAAKGAKVPSGVRLFVSGSAPLSIDTFTRFKTVFGHEILERYGMSETAMITSNLYSGPRKQGAVGKPLPGIQVRIVDADGRPAALKAPGEIQVRGPNLLKEYWQQPQKTVEAYQDGWFKTGDIGYVDEDGYIFICGRGKELIISGGFNVYPQEIINCLCNHPDIAEAAVIGVADKTHGELVKAYVVAKRADLTPEAVIEYCKSHLARFKVPKSVKLLEKLPRNAMGKLVLKDLPERDRSE
jgi:malonyl-CoA/methylmalonyl-CoA synthetase